MLDVALSRNTGVGSVGVGISVNIYKWAISQLFQQPPYNYDVFVFIKSRDRAWRKQGHRCIAAGRLGTGGKLLTTGGRNWLTAGGGKRLTAEGIKCDNK